jgi:type IV secretory pathway VirB10-like protein
MFSNKLAFILLALLGMAGAGAAGAYLASRPAEPAIPIAAPVPEEATADGAVEATDAVIDEPAAEPEPAPKPEVKPAPAPPARPRARRPEPTPAPRTESVRRAPSATPAAEPQPARTTTSERPRPAPRPLPGEHSLGQPTIASAPPRMESTAPVPELPPEPRFEDLTVAANSVIGLQLDQTISTETARIEDRVEARVTRDVRSLGQVAIPAGSRVLGSVSEIERGGKMKERARLGVRFHTLILADGTELPMQSETVYREGDSPANASAAKIGGGAIGGAILGAILGGGKGAAIGGAIGAGAGTTATMAGGRRPAELRAGSTVTVKLLSPVTVTVERIDD